MKKMNDLEQLTRTIVVGEQAQRKRVDLMTAMKDDGESMTDMLRRINAVRAEMGESEVTLGSVFLAIKRNKAKR
jgi:methyl coenzyme M reductase subunit D